MKIPIYQIDAFTNKLFRGNPAAVCPLEEWLPDDTLQNIAIENNLAETAFFTKLDDHSYHLRWFTPEIEMDLCGHATLASAYVIFEELDFQHETIIFETLSGQLSVKKEAGLLELNFPSRVPVEASLPPIISNALNIQPKHVLKARDFVLVYESEEDIKNIKPDIALLNTFNLDPGGIIITAPGHDVDFVSRFFTPQAAIFEDPVTGSAHCSLISYWADRLNKTSLLAQQLSERGGELFCELVGDRVNIRGNAVLYMKGNINL